MADFSGFFSQDQSKLGDQFRGQLEGTGGFASLFASHNPKVAAALAAFQFVGGTVDWFRQGGRKTALDNVLERRQRFNDMLDRQARGDFSDSERDVIWEANEPLLDHVYGGVAARGLAESGAGQEEITRAQMEPFFRAQEMAQRQLEQSFGQEYGMIKDMMASSPSLGRVFGGLFESYQKLQLYTGGERDPILDGLQQKLGALDERIKTLRDLEASMRAKMPQTGGK